MLKDIYTRINEAGVVPVVKIDQIEDALPLAQAFIAGGINVAEITFRTECAAAAIKAIKQKFPEMLVGSGTVLTIQQVDASIEAGAEFIVSPGLNPTIVKYCQSKNIPIMPGCTNPSDVEMALSLGLTYLKFFPAEASGGLNYIRALSGPFPQIKFMPTGGINENNLQDYLKSDKILACGGTWMCKASDISNNDYQKITELSKSAVKKVHNFQLAHIGINSADETQAKELANLFSLTFGFANEEAIASFFVSNNIEIMKKPYLGKKGHIAIACNNLKRAEAYLIKQGFSINEDSYKEKNNKQIAVYLNEEFGGFAVHLLER
ncbi:MAG: bifunctional 4-hydroxy-2-oxoglutarate aldolase/2-dehydro-3-deoxy-phosphogluconate aldolase [Erysipelotrichaceae bacterium]